MNRGSAGSTALYALGVLFGILTFIYFGVEVILNISPTLKSVLLLLGSFTLFAATGFSRSDLKNIPLYILSASSYLVFTLYTLVRFELGSALTFLLLAGSSAVFLGAGYLISEKGMPIQRKHARLVVPFLAGLIMVFFLYDVSGPQVEKDLELQQNVTVDQQNLALGEVRVSNSFLFSRVYEVDSYQVCLPEGERAIVRMDDRSGLLPGGESTSVELDMDYMGNLTNQTYSLVESEDCQRNQGEISVYPRNYD